MKPKEDLCFCLDDGWLNAPLHGPPDSGEWRAMTNDWPPRLQATTGSLSLPMSQARTQSHGNESVLLTRDEQVLRQKLNILHYWADRERRRSTWAQKIQGGMYRKEMEGGPFYVNEFRTIFGPVDREDGLNYVFIGTLNDEDPWLSVCGRTSQWFAGCSQPPDSS